MKDVRGWSSSQHVTSHAGSYYDFKNTKEQNVLKQELCEMKEAAAESFNQHLIQVINSIEF